MQRDRVRLAARVKGASYDWMRGRLAVAPLLPKVQDPRMRVDREDQAATWMVADVVVLEGEAVPVPDEHAILIGEVLRP